jgi:4-alpha-glucanotransferase
LGPLAVIAEDLGVITEPVHRLRDELGFPGMVILQFDFGRGGGQPHRSNSVTYTGTHDQDTIVGWWRGLDRATRGVVVDVLSRHRLAVADAIEWPLIELAFASESDLAMVQVQDVLGLGSEARMNVPGTASGNWGWRLEEGMLTAERARRLRAATVDAGRLR